MIKHLLCLALLAVLAACKPAEVTYSAREFTDLPAWQWYVVDGLSTSFEQTCTDVMAGKVDGVWGDVTAWAPFCHGLRYSQAPLRSLVYKYLQPVAVKGGQEDSLFTGYYSPLIRAQKQPSETFNVPLRGRPKDLLTINLAAFDPSLTGVLKGQLNGQRVLPYPERAEIEEQPAAAVAWLDDSVAKFGLQIQGSGVLEFADGSRQTIGFADHNGHGYTAIGRTLIQMGELTPEEVTWPAIKAWLKANPGRADEVFNSNARYIFFNLSNRAPVGARNIELVPELSMAVDPSYVPLGLPLYINTTENQTGEPINKIMFSHDVGAAIKGAVRGDIYFGVGEQAGALAGVQKSPGELFILVPKAIAAAL